MKTAAFLVRNRKCSFKVGKISWEQKLPNISRLANGKLISHRELESSVHRKCGWTTGLTDPGGRAMIVFAPGLFHPLHPYEEGMRCGQENNYVQIDRICRLSRCST